MESQKDLWAGTTSKAQQDLEIPAIVIAAQSKKITKDWIQGFAELMFEGVTYNKQGDVDFTKKMTPRMMEVDFDGSLGGSVTNKNIKVPVMGLVQYPALAMEKANITVNYEVGTKDNSVNDNKSAQEVGGGASGAIGPIGFNANFKFTASQSEVRTRDTDSRAKLNVSLDYSRLPPSEGMQRLVDSLLNVALSTDPAMSGGGAPAQ